jgi:hypothetical protein
MLCANLAKMLARSDVQLHYDNPDVLRIPTKSAGDSERSRPPVPIEAGRGFR